MVDRFELRFELLNLNKKTKPGTSNNFEQREVAKFIRSFYKEFNYESYTVEYYDLDVDQNQLVDGFKRDGLQRDPFREEYITATIQENGDLLWSHGYISRKYADTNKNNFTFIGNKEQKSFGSNKYSGERQNVESDGSFYYEN